MSSKNLPPPQKSLQEIEHNSKICGDLATQLSNRILKFEDWLNGIPGRVEANYWCGIEADDSEDPRDHQFVLSFMKGTKGWALYHGRTVDDEGATMSLLSDANLDTKIIAVKQLPGLLKEITKAQDARILQLKESHETLDALDRAIEARRDGEVA